ncbi:uncharacterized protein LOC110906860 [Helianthus annuus]|uniref:uncharacterized protein LOC110906860 n=1 Tax=Helianthus annuus TaxID=4232 RepID=UPI000B8F6FC2|nr:uncharacterized protein LOC110906860 [Helianthus annuus]
MTVMLEAVASNDLWIWHAYFGARGSNNNINLLHQSPLFITKYMEPPYRIRLWSTRDIIDTTSILLMGFTRLGLFFVKAISYPTEAKEKLFKKLYESTRKDDEQALAVLKGKWGMLNRPVHAIKHSKIKSLVYACIILHNMMIKDKGHTISPDYVMDPPTHVATFD